MPIPRPENQPIKQPYIRTRYTRRQLEELQHCAIDPVYFMQTYMKVRHPTKGMVDFQLYDYQKEIVDAYRGNTNVISMLGRQLGKCVVGSTIIKKGSRAIRISSLLDRHLSFRDHVVEFLEGWLIRLARKS